MASRFLFSILVVLASRSRAPRSRVWQAPLFVSRYPPVRSGSDGTQPPRYIHQSADTTPSFKRDFTKDRMESDGLPLYPSVYPHPTKIVQKDNMNQQIPTAMGSQQTQNPLVLLGPENTITTCPFCHASIKSAVKYTANTRTHMAAALCCLACCCCLPYCMDSAKNADHYCPNCQRYIGTYHK